MVYLIFVRSNIPEYDIFGLCKEPHFRGSGFENFVGVNAPSSPWRCCSRVQTIASVSHNAGSAPDMYDVLRCTTGESNFTVNNLFSKLNKDVRIAKTKGSDHRNILSFNSSYSVVEYCAKF